MIYIINRASALEPTRGLLHRLKMSRSLVHKRLKKLKLDLHFCPPNANSAFYFIARPCRQRSANGIQPNFAKRWTVDRAKICRRKFRVVPPENIEGQNVCICSVFRRLSLNGEYLLNKTRRRQSGKDIGKHGVP